MGANLIYEYYEKISDRYYVARLEGNGQHLRHFWIPDAKPVKVTGFESFDFFLTHEKWKHLQLNEALTGTCIINQDALPTREERRMTKKEFLRMIPDILKSKGGAGRINMMIIDYLQKYQGVLSPRYTTKEIISC